MAKHIVAIGGWPGGEEDEERLIRDFLLGLAPNERICFVPTAAADDAESVVSFYEGWRGRGELSHVACFPWPPPDARERIVGSGTLVVSGGNTANMLAIWRVHGLDRLLREAWEQGSVLCGWSAGMICWFEAGLTDSFGPQLDGMRDGLGLLSGSACPHYDGEERRRPVYQQLVRDGFPPGYAADDAVALHFADSELAEVVTARAGSQAYRVGPDGEEQLAARLLA